MTSTRARLVHARVVQDFVRKHPKVSGLLAGAVVLLAFGAVLIGWEIGYECVRWSTRINVDDYGGVSTTKVCVETRPRWGSNVGK